MFCCIGDSVLFVLGMIELHRCEVVCPRLMSFPPVQECGGYGVGVGSEGRAIPGNVLLSEIYILAHSDRAGMWTQFSQVSAPV